MKEWDLGDEYMARLLNHQTKHPVHHREVSTVLPAAWEKLFYHLDARVLAKHAHHQDNEDRAFDEVAVTKK